MFPFLNPVLDFMFGWSLNLPPFLAIGVLSLLWSVVIVLITKFATDQNLMKSLKDEIKELQKEMRTLRDNPAKLMEVNKRAMEVNGKYMSKSMKVMLLTLLPALIFFGWMSAHFALDPIHPGQEFSLTLAFEKGSMGNVSIHAPDGMEITGDATRIITDGNAIFTLKSAAEGTYEVTVEHADKTYVKEVLISSKKGIPVESVKKISDGSVKTMAVSYAKAKVIQIGSWGFGWLFSYFVFSLAFSLILRKFLKVY